LSLRTGRLSREKFAIFSSSLERKNFNITTNYGLLIETMFVESKMKPGYPQSPRAAETTAERVILTKRDYRNILYRAALQSIFTMYSVILLGSSLGDPD
jgi:hypothetical protein